MPNDLFERMVIEAFRTSEAAIAAIWQAWYPAAERTGKAHAVEPAYGVAPDVTNVESQDEMPVQWRCDSAGPMPVRTLMYNLQKAKEEIDTVAKHATDLAAHVFAVGEGMEARFAAFKTDILGVIDKKFSDLERAFVGSGGPPTETTMISDLAAKIALLKHRAPSLHGPESHEPAANAPFAHDPDRYDQASHNLNTHNDRVLESGHVYPTDHGDPSHLGHDDHYRP